MPFPLLGALVPPLIAWGSRALATYGLARLFSEEPVEELKQMLVGWVVQHAAERAGLVLDPDDPFSDASMATAVGNRIGMPLRSLRDRAMLEEDVEAHLVSLLSERSGYEFHSVRDVAILKTDLSRIAGQVVSEQVGVPLQIVEDDGSIDPEAVKARLLVWAKGELLANMGDDVSAAVAQIAGMADFEAVAAELNAKLENIDSRYSVTGLQIAQRVAGQMAARAVTDFGVVANNMSKRTRRQLQLRAAQQKFRAAHGNRQQYVPLGMSATVG